MSDLNREISDLHNHAMELAREAKGAMFIGDTVVMADKFLEAYALELKAASMVNYQPYHAILYASAASLALACGTKTEARRLIKIALDFNPEPPADLLKKLKEIEFAANSE